MNDLIKFVAAKEFASLDVGVHPALMSIDGFRSATSWPGLT
ncbi:hypothetical protein [Mesorhizobium sp. M0621]